MNRIQIHKTPKEIELTRLEFFKYYIFSTLFILLILCLILLYVLRTPIFYTCIIIVVAGAYILYKKKADLSFKKINSKITDQQFKKAFNNTLLESDGQIKINESNYVIGHIPTLQSFHGIRITALKKEKHIFLNTIIEPTDHINFDNSNSSILNKIITVFNYHRLTVYPFYYYSRTNLVLKTLMNNIEDVVNHEDSISKINQRKLNNFYSKSKWSLKHVLMRFTAWLIFITSILLGIMFIKSGVYAGIIVTFIISSLFLYYLYYDIKILLNKRRNKNQ